MWRALLSRLAVASSAVVAVLVACEIALRVYVSPAEDTGKTVAAEPAKLMRQEPRTGWVPNEGARVEKRDASGSPYVVRINSTGQRGPEVPRRRLGERRLLFLGDSYTMADQVSERETFVDLTGNLLGEAIGRPVVSVNGGVNGYGTYQEMAYYRYYGRPVDADVVVLVFFPGNDYRDNMTHTLNGSSLNPVYLDKPERYARHGEDLLRDAGKRAILDPFSGDAIPRPESAWVESLQRRSLLGRLLGSRFAKLEGRLTGNLFLLDLSSRYYFYEIGYYQTRDDGYFATARELTIECLDLLRQWVRWDGAELVVVLLPSPYQVGVQQLWQKMLVELRVDEEDLGPLDFTYPNRLIASLCRERGVPYLDLTAAFARADNSANLYLTAVGDGHMSAAGHALLARELTGFLHAEIAPLQNPDIDTYWRLKGQLRAGRLTAAGELLKQSPVAQTSTVQRLPSSPQSLPLGACTGMHACACSLQMPLLQTSSSPLQSNAEPLQIPSLHVSPTVQKTPSEQAKALAASADDEQVPVARSQLSAVQGLPSSHCASVTQQLGCPAPRQTPPKHASSAVHSFPSSQGVFAGADCSVHACCASSQTPS